jgi:hypothetical protein
MPAIRAETPSIVTVEIPRVSSILFTRQSWRALSIRYDIGEEDYPHALMQVRTQGLSQSGPNGASGPPLICRDRFDARRLCQWDD